MTQGADRYFNFDSLKEAQAFNQGVEWINDNSVLFLGAFRFDAGLVTLYYIDNDKEASDGHEAPSYLSDAHLIDLATGRSIPGE